MTNSERAAGEEETFFASIRAMPPSFRTVIVPSRSGGPDHFIHLDNVSNVPWDVEHPCSCAAGAAGRWCWAVLQTLVREAPGTQSAEIAAEILARRNKKGQP